MGGAGVQIVETRIFWEVLWWKHLHMKNIQKNNHAKLQKNMEKTKKKVQTHVPCQASPQTLPMGLNFLFFCFFWFSRGFGQTAKKTMEKPKFI